MGVTVVKNEITRDVEEFLRVVFEDRKTVRLDLEATEMALRAALHRAGAVALGQLLELPARNEERRTRACPCGQHAHYREQRSKPVLTAAGRMEVSVPTIGAHTAASANSPLMSNWISKIQNSLPECAACSTTKATITFTNGLTGPRQVTQVTCIRCGAAWRATRNIISAQKPCFPAVRLCS
jgi:hypothetical protein